MFPQIFTPALLLDEARLDANIAAMQTLCDANGIELRPHIKTHKCVHIARRQLQAGAAGLTCAKVGEAEAMLPAFEGLERGEMFIAHSLVDPNLAPRLRHLRENLDELVLAVTSELHAPVLSALVEEIGDTMPVMMAFDSGLGREGARTVEGARKLARVIENTPNLELRGIYTHEGHFYAAADGHSLEDWHANIVTAKCEVEREIGRNLKLWPGCSASAPHVASMSHVDGIRPGAYLIGDLYLSEITHAMTPDDLALHVLATVVDLPAQGLALLDSGSKTLSIDRTPDGVHARCAGGEVFRVNEEHGYLRGEIVDKLKIGDRILLAPAHICPVMNLADQLFAIRDETILETWPIEARGKVN